MRLRLFALLLTLMLFTGAALAHGNKVHVLGRLEKINANSVLVKTKDGKSVEVKLATSTVYLSHSSKEDKPAKQSDLALGDLVVIHATPNGEVLSADEIKFSPSGSSATGASAAKPKP
jgi:hypothetical protein